VLWSTLKPTYALYGEKREAEKRVSPEWLQDKARLAAPLRGCQSYVGLIRGFPSVTPGYYSWRPCRDLRSRIIGLSFVLVAGQSRCGVSPHSMVRP